MRLAYDLTVQAGAALTESSQIAEDTTIRVLVRREDAWVMDRLLRVWARVSAARVGDDTS